MNLLDWVYNHEGNQPKCVVMIQHELEFLVVMNMSLVLMCKFVAGGNGWTVVMGQITLRVESGRHALMF